MAGDWIKMRTDLYRDPKVCMIADCLMDERGELAAYVRQNKQRDMAVTRNVTRNVTVGALVTVWGVTRHRGKRVNDDLVVRGATLDVIDDIADLPGFGNAMARVGWAVETDDGVIFPHFFEDLNVEPALVQKEKAAERQRRYREKRNALRDVTVTSQSNARVEESREEKSSNTNTPKAPVGGESYTDEFLQFWNAFPVLRRGAKRTAWKAWQRAVRRRPAEDIIQAAREYAASDVGRSEYAKGPGPWLSGDCWDDDRNAWGRPAASSGRSPGAPGGHSEVSRSEQLAELFRNGGGDA